MRSKVMILATILGFVGGALVLALVWTPFAAVFAPPYVVGIGSPWTEMGWWSLLIGLVLAPALSCLSKSSKRWAAWTSFVAGALMIAGGLAMVTYDICFWGQGGGFLWPAIVVLALAGGCHLLSGIFRIKAKKAQSVSV